MEALSEVFSSSAPNIEAYNLGRRRGFQSVLITFFVTGNLDLYVVTMAL